MSGLRLFLFGVPRLDRGGDSLSISRRKGLALLAYVALRGQPQSREALATLLWPEFDQSRALSNLRRELSRLKSDLEADILEADRLQIALAPDAALWVDVKVFRQHLETVAAHGDHFPGEPCEQCRAALTEAAALHTERFLGGFNLPDAPEFDDWQFFEAEALSRAFGDALHRLIQWHAGVGEYEVAIDYGRRWLALDTLHEVAHRELMALYARAGQQAAAIRQYEECERLLAEELGVEPEAETTALYEAIRTRHFPAEQEPAVPAALAAPVLAAPLPPNAPERYLVEEQIAVGGQGEVFLGRDQVTDTPVIIKRLRPELATDSARVSRFLRESEALGQLDHPNIVHMLATFERDGYHCIVMEYVPGGTLAELLAEQGPLPLAQVLSLALELADALGRAHHLGIIHRDIKPGNVLLTEAGAPRLTDFGTARLAQEDVRLTTTGMLVGSPAYMSPEALRGDDLDPRSDIWSFGVLLYEMLAGKRPFEGEGITQILVRILGHAAPGLTTFRDDLPPALIALIEKMLAKEAAERPSSMRQVAAELEAIRAGKWEMTATGADKLVSPLGLPSLARSLGQTPSTITLPERPFAPTDQQIRVAHSADGTRIAYAVVGQGSPLVKVANPLTHLQYDWESPVWRHWIEELSREHVLIRYDERGCGLSDRQVSEFSMDAWVSDLEAVVDDLGLERFPIISTSQGPSVAIAYAVRHPERVSHIICCGGYARGRFHRELTPEERAETETLLNLIRFGWGKESPAFRQVFASLFVPEGSPDQHRWFTELARVTADPETAARMERAFYDIDVTDLAPQVLAPTLVLHPRGDQMVPFAEGRLLAELIPGARFVPLESNNHLLLADEPAWAQFREEVRRFLETPGAASPRQWTGFTAEQHPESTPLAQAIHFCRASDGVQIAYATVGEGPPLVKAANWLSHLEYDWESPVWHHWLTGLARQHQLIRYDERGCGLSDWNVGDMSFDAWVRDLETVVEAVGVWRFPLLGISQGAAIAVAYAHRHPERVSHLILYGGYARGRRHREDSNQEEVRVLTDLIRIGWGQEHAAFRQVFTSLFLPEGTPEQFAAFNELQRRSSTAENAARIVEGFSQIDVSELAAELQVPTLVLHAQGDLRIPFSAGRHLASLIPGARFVPLNSKNHILQEHEPAWNQFLEEVHHFLQSPAVPDSGGPHLLPQAIAPAAPSTTPLAPSTVGLRASPDPLIGREQDLAEIERLLTGHTPSRLLTLVGPGGIGKTRLAMATAESLAPRFPDGAAFLSLASLTTAEQIVPAIAERIGLEFLEAGDEQQQLLQFLEPREQLLVLDNFEHLLDGVRLVDSLLERAPGLVVLATSREPLNLSSETVYRVGGLAYPEETSVTTATPVSFGAVALLLQQLQRHRPGMVPGPGEWRELIRICRLVEGMPLALVLAANWIELLSLAEIGDEIEGNLDLLEADMRDLPARQRSVRAVFNASWEMLSMSAQAAMARLSVFRGPFSRAAAQAVAGCSLLTLRTLLNKSWLQRREERFELHDLVRQYAALKLRADPGAEEEVHAAHAAYYLQLLDEQSTRMKGPQQEEAFAVVGAAFEQVGAAWRWLVAQGRLDAVVQQLLPPLYRYCEGRARASELFPLLRLALESPAATADPALQAILLAARSVFLASGQPIRFESMGSNFIPIYLEENIALWRLAKEQEIPAFWRIGLSYSYGRVVDAGEAINMLEALVAQLRADEDEWLLAFALQHLGMLIQYRDPTGKQVADAVIHLTEALAIMERLGDLREAGYTMRALGHLWLAQENLTEAIAQWQQALALLQQVGDWVIAAQMHWHIGDAYQQLGQVDTAFRHYRTMSEIAVSRANRRFAANVVSKESYEAARYGRFELARQTRQESLALARASNDPFIEGWCNWEMGELCRLRGELDEADTWFERSLQIFNRNDDNPGRCFYQRGKAELALARGEPRMARSYYGRSLALADENDHDWARAYALKGLAQATLALGDVEEAQAHSVRALIHARETGDRAVTLATLAAAAAVLKARGNPDMALEIATFVAEHPVSWQEVRAQARQLQATITLPPARKAVVPERMRGQQIWELVNTVRLALADPTAVPVSADGYSLPAYATPFVGREAEIAELRRLLLAEPDCRLVTVTGPGGIGKTRLALQVAAQIRVSLPHGVYFVPLTPLSSAEQIVPAIAESLDVELQGDGGARQQLLEYLHDKELLLLLDNFEHILPGRDLVDAILRAAPAVTILVTSREALALSRETVFPLGGLLFPDSVEMEGDFSALELFLQQAQRLRPDYTFTTEDRREAARISRLVQGMPLALVLAAGWFDMLSFGEIAEEIAASLDFLEGEARDLPARQQSIRGAFDYSWKHLSATEQRTFSQLSVFRGGFTRQAAESVTAASLQMLRSLVNKSFLTAVPGGRYEIHELLRQYGEAALAAAGEAEAARQRHTHYYLDAIAAQWDGLKSRRQQQVLEQIEPDMKNVQAAVLWAATQAEAQRLEAALESVYFYYDTPVYGRHAEGVALFSRVLEHLPPDSLLRARFLVRQRSWQTDFRRERPKQLREEVEYCLAQFEKAGLTVDVAFSLFLLAEQQILVSGDFAAALPLFIEAQERYAESGDRYHVADAAAMIGYCHGVVSDLAHSEQATQEALALSRETGNRRMEAFALTSLAAGAFAAGAYDEAAQYSEAALQVAVPLRVVGSTALAEGGIALTHILRGELTLAVPIAERGLQREREMEWRPAVMYGLALTSLTAAFAGDYELAQSRSAEAVERAPVPFNRILAHWAAAIAASGLEKDRQAWQHVQEGLTLAKQQNYRGMFTWFLPVGALLLHRIGQQAPVVELLALAASHPLSASGWSEQWALIADARAHLEIELGAEAYRAVWERGRALDLDAAVARLLAIDPEIVTSLPGGDSVRPVDSFSPAFVGREEELAWLEGGLAAAVAGQGHVCFVVGEAGQGKTTLLHAFIRRAQQHYPQLVAATGYCNAYTGHGDPYLPFREILQLLTGDVTRGSGGDLPGTYTQRLLAAVPHTLEALVNSGAHLLESFLPARPLLRRVATQGPTVLPWLDALQTLAEAATETPDTAPPLQQGALFAEYGDLLAAVARRQPLLLCVDDLQWSDEGTANLLLHLGKHLTGQPILLIGAYRPAEVAAGRAGQRHPLEQVVHELQREFGSILLDLGESDGRAFVDALLNAQPNRLDEHFRATLFAQTAGQPLFTVELLRGMQERGDLTRATDGAWIASASLDWDTLPARVEGAIGERIGRLKPRLRELLQAASVVGEAFSLELLARLGAGGPRELARLFSQELGRGHRLVRSLGVRQEGGRRLSRYRFRHILIQRYLYQSMDEVERVYRHEEVAEALETLYGADAATVAVEVAHHFAAARRWDRAAPYYREAGDQARRAGALMQATHHYERALAAWIEEDRAAHAELRRQLGECTWISGQLDAAFGHFQAAYELYLASGDETGAGAMQAALGRLHWEQGDRQRALQADQEALALLEQGPETVELASVYSSISQLHMLAWKHDEAVAWGERALRLARQLEAPQVLSHALNNVGFSQIWLGKQEEALANLRESKALALEHRLPHDAGRAFYNLGSALLTLDRYDEAWAEFNGMLEHGQRWHVPLYAGSALAELAGVEWLTGRWRPALARRTGIQEWVEHSESLTYLEILNNLVLASIAVTLGQPEVTLSYLDHIALKVERTDEGQMWMPYLHARIQALAMLGRQEEVAEMVEKLLTLADPSFAMHSDSLLPLGSACTWAAEQRRWAEADVLLGQIREINARLDSQSAAAMEQECAGVIAFYQDNADEATNNLRQAVDGWQQLGRPYDEARACEMLSRALAAAGQDAEALSARNRAWQLLEMLAVQLDDEPQRTSFLASPLVQAVAPELAAAPPSVAEAHHGDYKPLLAAVEEVASRQEQTGRGGETMALKGMVGALQASLHDAEARLNRMEQIEQELALARRVQQRMLQRIFPAVSGYAFATRYIPARAVGGDFYDVIRLDEERLGLAIADVVGKGMPAALMMTLTRSLLLAEAPHARSPAQLLQRVNDLLLAAGDGEAFVTIFYAVLEPACRRLTYARAGHDYPLLLRDDVAVELDSRGMALGVLPGSELDLEENTLSLEPGDRLVLYSDGLTDVVAPDGMMYGKERLIEALLQKATAPVDSFCDLLFEELATFSAGTPQSDDMTMLLLAVTALEEKAAVSSPA